MEVDILFRGGYVYNSNRRQFIKEKLAVKGERILYLGEDPADRLKPVRVVDLDGKYLIPGLIDIHMHIESSMTSPVQFAGEVIKRGVTTVVSEPHEIANVFGLRGVEAMINAAAEAVIDIYYAAPSSVPSTSSELETNGGEIGPDEVRKLAAKDEILCLGEVMDNKTVIQQPDSKINKIIDAFREAAPFKPIEGHIPDFLEYELARLVSRGVDSDHTYHTIAQARDRLKQGVMLQIQEKSMYQELFSYIQEQNLLDQMALVTDDVMADFLVENGHLDKIVRKAANLGFTIEEAVYLATASPADRMNLRDRGRLLPGKLADIIILNDPENFLIHQVYKRGRLVADEKGLIREGCFSENEKKFPADFYKSVALELRTEADFALKTDKKTEFVKVRVIEVKDDSTYTEESKTELPVSNKELAWEESDLAIIGVFSRYQKDSSSLGLVGGEIIKEGAVATTYAHDHHNLLVVSQNKKDAVTAANWVIENNGGYCVVKNGNIQAALKLPVAGILSEKPITELAADLKDVRAALHAQGYRHYNAIMSVSTLTLPVSPKLKITDRGIINVAEGQVKSLIVEVIGS